MKNLLFYPDPLLTTVCEEITNFEEAKDIIAEMKELMKNMPMAIGLSANQIGYSKRICLLRNGQQEIISLINPREAIIEKDAKFFYKKEFCLSLPGVHASLHAPEDLTVVFQDEEGQERTMSFDGIMARAFLHEAEHLNGRTIMERTNSINRSSLMLKYNKFMARNRKNFSL